MIHDTRPVVTTQKYTGNPALKGDTIINSVIRDSSADITGILYDIVPNGNATITNKNSHCGNVHK